MMVGILTDEQRNLLVGKKYNEHYYFNPIKDENDFWVVTEYEIEHSDLDWLKNVPRVEFKPSTFKINI